MENEVKAMENTSIRWFLGANSRRGFASLYRGFPPEGAYLHIIKGGPGTGKSSLMRRIAAAARSAGLGVEYILCSGDPDSLDAVYIPELGAAWADGTAPHALEPEVFGADGAYLDTSQCCSQARLRSGADELRRLTEGYRLWYSRAYELLAAAAAVSPSISGAYLSGEAAGYARKRAAGFISRELGGCREGAVARRYLGGLTCAGRYLLTDTLEALCPRLILLDNRLGAGFVFTEELAKAAEGRGLEAVLCPHWLEPGKTEAVIFPSLGLGFAVLEGGAAYPGRHRRLHLDRAGGEEQRALAGQLRADERAERALLERAGQSLAAAKAVHDGLEAAVKPSLDFAALDALAEREIRALGLAAHSKL